MVKKNSLIEVQISELAHGNGCIGTILSPESAAGKKALIPNTVPGEVVRARITKDSPRLVFATMLEVLSEVSARISPPCPYFTHCGGCDLQHMELSTQRALKKRMVENALRYSAKIVPLHGVDLLGEDLVGFHYRRRIRLHVGANGDYGFYQAQSRSIVAVEQCDIARESLNTVLLRLRNSFPLLPNRLTEITLFEELDNTIACSLEFTPDCSASEQRSISSNIEDVIQIRPIGFSQINPEANRLLQTAVVDATPHGRILELYCGSGNFSFPLVSDRTRTLLGVENSTLLVQQADERRRADNLEDDLKFVCADAEHFSTHDSFDALILDPPRRGARDFLLRTRPDEFQKIIYVSCNIATLCRDLALLDKKQYRLERVSVLDMFPQTHHVECIAVLSGSPGHL